jgi:hypothetical protein
MDQESSGNMEMIYGTTSNAPATGGQDELHDDRSFDCIMRDFGWDKCSDSTWRRPTSQGDAHLCVARVMAAWRRFDIAGGAVTLPSRARCLHHNSVLRWPVKYAVAAQGEVRCRGDLPQAAEHSDDLASLSGSFTAESRYVQWVRAITGLVEGRVPSAGPALDLDRMVEHLAQSGRAVSRDGDRVLVHFHLPGAFSQIRYEHDPCVGPRLAADLLTLAGHRRHFHRAAMWLASEANWRLPLVRFALCATQPPVLSCEVCFGTALIPSDWLMAGLEAMEAALSLTLRELQALRDPTLARLLVAVSTA